MCSVSVLVKFWCDLGEEMCVHGGKGSSCESVKEKGVEMEAN